jgi:hypothetical protein
MVDDVRIQRLTEMARKMWPDRELMISVSEHPVLNCYLVSLVEDGGCEEDSAVYLSVIADEPDDSRALDAIRAALLAFSTPECLPDDSDVPLEDV